MIIVTGEPRSGTSLMMETVRLLGYDVWGEEQPRESQINKEETFEDQVLREKAHWMNEKFWEINGIVMRGINNVTFNNHILPILEKEKTYEEVLEEKSNHAIKIIWNGLIRTDRKILENSKIILCLRNPLHVAESQTHLEHSAKVAQEIQGKPVFMSPNLPISPFRYMRSAVMFIRWLQRPMNNALDMLTVDYDDMVFNSSETIEKVAKFLDANQKNIPLAVSNVNVERRRSAIPERPDEHTEEWDLINDLYDYLKEGILTDDAVNNRIAEYEEYYRNNPENARWLCKECHWPMNVNLWRSYLKKPELRKKMLANTEKKRAARMLCTQCPLYKEHDETDEIVLPEDLDNIVRHKVDCPAMGKVSLEECHEHYKLVRKDNDFFKKYQS